MLHARSFLKTALGARLARPGGRGGTERDRIAIECTQQAGTRGFRFGLGSISGERSGRAGNAPAKAASSRRWKWATSSSTPHASTVMMSVSM